jgi:spermidine synthase
MIAHLPLNSHPNPKKVLVIGGGDGGVVREVLKHESVEEVVLCDIDEVIINPNSISRPLLKTSGIQAVIRVSKTYLPHMSAPLESPRVTIFVGDGFKFLAENTSTYDVIITDSSDPMGPAESLFQKPYFQLLHDALAPGGHISTQSECLWVHLPLINNVMGMTRELFPVAEYAFTTIPTYPCGQIGFAVCSKEAGRDVRKPLRKIDGTRYYNAEVHRAAFALPEFGRAMLQEGKNILPVLERVAAEGSAQRKILLLGSGFVARPAAEYVVRDPRNHLTVGEHRLFFL